MLTEDELQEEIDVCNQRASTDQKGVVNHSCLPIPHVIKSLPRPLLVRLALDTINVALQEGDSEAVMAALTAEYAGIEGLDESVGARYQEKLQQVGLDKGEVCNEKGGASSVGGVMILIFFFFCNSL